MTINNIDVDATIKQVKDQLAEEKDLSPAIRSSLEVLLLLVTLLASRFGLNSNNSSKPPSADPHRTKKPRAKGTRKPGGQPGRRGSTLQPVPDPDEVEVLQVDRGALPPGRYRQVGYESRQVVDLDISRVITEFRAQILEDQQGNRYVAPFPEGVTRPVQYGNGVKVNTVYMSQFQLVPYSRIGDYLWEQMQIPVSVGSIYNFNQEAYDRLDAFDCWVRKQLVSSRLLHADETGINIGGKRYWLHSASNADFTFFHPHTKRGGEALDAIDILPAFAGILCHDHWKPYYQYGTSHALCNAHHLRELERAWEQDKQQWAQKMALLLKEINTATLDAGGHLNDFDAGIYRKRYRSLLEEADKECPAPDESQRKGRRGRLPRSKARNLLERLRDFESDVLRFMVADEVPFSNNLAENDLRMTKVQQKISGCFRSWEGAKMFCRIRSYLSTCRKQGLTASAALRLLFEGKSPQFMESE
ncbi:MAG TPA: IS66 family transposase [Pelovirga sp.]|nr:IS66 family transposase [Pelovirga sp.]